MKASAALLIALVCALGTHSSAARPDKPNIVFFLADDYGLNGVGCYGSDRFKGRTPNIDALAKSGLRFEQCYSMPTCNPSRCALMTGRYGFRTGNNPSFKSEPSVAKVLKQAGYVTGMAGKWRQMDDTPGDWGFDEYVTDPEASGYYWETTYTKNGQPVKTDQPAYYPDVCLDFAVDFFKQHREQPFFFYYPTHLIHNPIVRTPDSKPGTTDPEVLYEDNVAYLDKELGKVAARNLLSRPPHRGRSEWGSVPGSEGVWQLIEEASGLSKKIAKAIHGNHSGERPRKLFIGNGLYAHGEFYDKCHQPGIKVIAARNLLSRPPHRGRSEWGSVPGSEGVWLLGICFRARRTVDGRNGDRCRGVRGSGS